MPDTSEKRSSCFRVLAMLLLLLLMGYVSVAWSVFAIRHTKAGSGAFFVHFVEVMTFGEVPELQENGDE